MMRSIFSQSCGSLMIMSEFVSTFATTLNDAVLEPYVGYWLLALRQVTVLFPPPTLIPFAQEPTVAAAVPDDG